MSCYVILYFYVFLSNMNKRADVFVFNDLKVGVKSSWLGWRWRFLCSKRSLFCEKIEHSLSLLVIVETSIFLTRNVVQNHKPTADPVGKPAAGLTNCLTQSQADRSWKSERKSSSLLTILVLVWLFYKNKLETLTILYECLRGKSVRECV